ncbi:NADH dehydrogenase [Alteromonas macleodii]|uniref:NADH dehydrogenase n=1 Tax=Alteromonas macleodii TaxID=28108 RepID=A0AB36FWH0_ALTMA|nr:NADH dehydrogenase [Alteromonas macleodii]MEC8374537.1 hypothetical protein [Pseudomonadota bacterium]OES33530.1 hypothetical protein BFV95_1036 [Alteromonas macleodii]OES34597.1 hypothetical protein BFV94_1036 [Alteromonas macleodii]OES37061.1 hypothetical protein BFV93_1036 [Alteromonas macleodii]OES42912.1 hypothetical protein BFV96_1036 [Alteromonas macleodii]|tara:strand:+ start:11800 stop:12741 length:942 start_codon:yes stop_codon:yes gene_type:complete
MTNEKKEKKQESTSQANIAGSIHKRLNDLFVLQGRALANANKGIEMSSLHDVEFKVFSQFGEDGIIQYLQQRVIQNEHEKTFVEFGVENYLESNTRFLLVNNNWKGLVMDGDAMNIESIKKQDFYWRHDLTAKKAWIDKENINDLIASEGFEGEIGLLSIDVDGNDFWIWQAIEAVNPIMVVVEYNSVFGGKAAVSVPYSSSFQRNEAHYSNLYYGASIAALHYLGKEKGYELVGSNSAGNNLFFVRNDRLGSLRALSPSESYVESKMRESRDRDGKLTFKSGEQRRSLIKGLPVVEVKTGETHPLGHYFSKN